MGCKRMTVKSAQVEGFAAVNGRIASKVPG